LLKPGLPLPGKPEIITGPSGVAAVDHTLFITDDRPWPGPGTAAGPFDTADYARWLDKCASRPFGGIYVCSSDNCDPHLIDGSLLHPSGVAAASPDGPVFVAEADSHEVRWPIYKNDLERGWIRAGALG